MTIKVAIADDHSLVRQGLRRYLDMAEGIEVVYQDLALCDNLTAAANVFLGREMRKTMGVLKILDYRTMYERAAMLFAELKSETRPRDLVKQMSGGQRQAVAIACHVGRWGDCDRLIAETLARTGRLDVLVNNAGMSPLYDSLDAVSEELFDKTLAVNLKGPFRLAVLAATQMAARDGGSIINIGTTASLTASVGELPYACAKAGLNALTVGLAEAFAPRVRVNAILPGPFRTDWAGRSLRQTPSQIADYADTAGARMAGTKEVSGTQAGDPVRAGEAIIAAVGQDVPPRHLVLGAFGYEAVAAKLRERLAAIEAARDISLGADFPADAT